MTTPTTHPMAPGLVRGALRTRATLHTRGALHALAALHTHGALRTRGASRTRTALRTFGLLGVAGLASLASVAALAPDAAAQGGGFIANEIFVYNAAAQGISSNSGAVLRCDPVTGATSLYVDLTFSQQQQGSAAFDPYRQRVVFCASLAAADPFKLWFADGAGTVQDSGLGSQTFHSLAPVGDGRIYLRDVNTATGPLKWIDAAGALHVLLGASGPAPFSIDGLPTYDVGGMLYDAGTNALLVASRSTCSGGTAGKIYVRKLPLSADGTRVVGSVGCGEFEVSPSGEVSAGISRLPAGLMLLGVDTNSNDQEPRLLVLDPVTLALGVFASNGSYTGAAATNASCWSTALGKGLILDTFVDTLRAFPFGASGGGTVIATSMPVSSDGSSGETPAMFEIPFSACSGGWIAYGKGLAGKGAFVPTLTGTGCPEPGSAFTLTL